PILYINKIDKKDERALEVVDMTFNLFMELGATDEQLDFKILYGSARDGYAIRDLNDKPVDLTPLFETIVETVEPFKGNQTDKLQLQISQLAYDDYIGRLGVGRINKGTISAGETVSLAKNDGTVSSFRVTKLFINEGIRKVEVTSAYFGDIVTVAGCANVSIGDTICEHGTIDPLPKIIIEQPTLSMNFLVNNSPFAGQSGKFLTSRHLKDRLEKELETNVGLTVEALPSQEGYKVSGRGELHLSILLESMRREGYELSVSKPEVIIKEIDGVKCEPFENVICNIPDEYSGTVIQSLNERKGTLETISPGEEGYTRIVYSVPTRGLIGYRGNFITETKGEGIMVRSFDSYKPYTGAIAGRKNGVLVTMVDGTTFGYSLFNLCSRGTMIVDPSVDVYCGMIIGIGNKEGDLNVNPCKNKELTNTRSAHADEAIALNKARKFTLEEALEFIEDDEYIEITPTEIRLRKKILDPKYRYRK
ncbi:MAG: translational GTPase TypA, partial [Bacilli bacterium]